jgi:hypothetical protein
VTAFGPADRTSGFQTLPPSWPSDWPGRLLPDRASHLVVLPPDDVPPWRTNRRHPQSRMGCTRARCGTSGSRLGAATPDRRSTEHYAGGLPWQSPSVPGAPCGRP